MKGSHLGSPLPDTPISDRKKREFSSQYGGLEKEVSSFKNPSFLRKTTTSPNKSQLANVYEGLVRVFIYYFFIKYNII